VSCNEFGAGLDGLRDVDVRLRPVFDLNEFLVLAVGSGGNSGNGECGSMSSWAVVIGDDSRWRFHQVADLTITFSLLLPLYHVESSILQSQSTIQVSTCRYQRTPGLCKQHRGRWSANNSQSIQRAGRCCWGPRTKGRRRGSAVCYRCNQGIDVNSPIIAPINEQTENISKCGRS